MSALLETVGASWPSVKEAARDWELPDLSAVWISVTSAPLNGAELTICEEQALRAAEANRGWLRYQSAAFEGIWSPSDEWGDPKCRGRFLWAEWASEQPKGGEPEENTSYRITPDPQKPGCARRYTYRERSDAADGFRPALRQEAILQGHQPGRDLVYCVYWGAPDNDESAMRRLFARFVRFNGEVR